MTDKEIEGFVEFTINITKEDLLKDKKVNQCTYILGYHTVDMKNTIFLVPGLFQNQHEKEYHVNTLRTIIRGLKDEGTVEVHAVIAAMDAKFKKVNKDEYASKDFVRPLDDPDSQEALVFIVESKKEKKQIIYEYIRFADNDIVINEKPKVSIISDNVSGLFANLLDS
jgi:hypothetical protein